MIEMQRVTTPEQIDAVATLAREIWQQHFVPIIGPEQVEYMLDKFQSGPAITRQIAEGYEYYLVLAEGQRIGYVAIVPQPAEDSAMLSKIYLRKAQRGRGFGRQIVEFAQKRGSELGVRKLWLTVNRSNAGPIAFYRRMGFDIDEELVQDIGNGFVMDDYKMVKPIYVEPGGTGVPAAPEETIKGKSDHGQDQNLRHRR